MSDSRRNSAPPRIAVLNGSPRPDGNSVRLARLFAECAGAVPDITHLYDNGPAPCRACLVCASGGRCPIPDGMEALMERIARADCLVLASPLHFSSLTAPMVAFISRLQPWWHSGTGLLPKRPRSGVLLVSGGSEYGNMFRPARSVAAAAFKVLGMRFAGMAARANTDSGPIGDNDRVIDELKLLAERIAPCSSGS